MSNNTTPNKSNNGYGIGNIGCMIGSGIFMLWVVRNIYAYFVLGLFTSKGEESAVEEFQGLFEPFLQKETLAKVLDTKIRPLFNERKFAAFFHVGISQIFAMAGLYNLWTGSTLLAGGGGGGISTRRSNHRLSGQVYMICLVGILFSIVPLILNAKEGVIMTLNEFMVTAVVVGFGFKGYYDIKYKKDYESHRSSMIMSASGMFNLFLRRPLLPLFHAFVPNIDHDHVNFEYYKEAVWGGAVMVAFIIVQGVALYVAFIQGKQGVKQDRTAMNKKQE